MRLNEPAIYRPPEPSEAAALAELSRTTFCDTFAHLYASEDLSLFLNAHKTEAAFARALSDGRHLFQVAEQSGQLVGYCKLGLDATLDDLPAEWEGGIELKELYLRSGVQGTGVGPALMEWSLAEARQLGAPVLVLSVWSENFPAQRFYQRYGFVHIADTSFMVGNHRDHEFLYGLRLERTQ
jgi:diamine N-acetyltransferase